MVLLQLQNAQMQVLLVNMVTHEQMQLKILVGTPSSVINFSDVLTEYSRGYQSCSYNEKQCTCLSN